MNLINSSNSLSSSFSKFLLPWTATGLTAQLGLVFWPISNYSTIVYLLFFLPLLILFVVEYKNFVRLISAPSVRPIFIILLALFAWIMLSSLWSNLDDSNGLELFTKTLKINFLIITYIFGIAFLAHHSLKFLVVGLAGSGFLVAAIALTSLIDQFLLKDLEINVRLRIFGIGNWNTVSNSVTAGIYFGMFSVLTGTMLITTQIRKNFVVSIPIGAAFVICFLTTYFTGTRSALVASLFSLVLILLLARRWALVLLISVSVVGLLSYGLLGESSYLKDFLVRGGLGSWRPQIWFAAWQVGSEHFWLGTGMWESTEFAVTRKNITTTVPHSHNFYLQLLNWTGIIGLSLYVSLLVFTVKLATSLLNKPLVFVSTMVLSYFLIVQIFDVYNIFTKPSYYWPCIWLPLGIIIGHAYDPKSEVETI